VSSYLAIAPEDGIAIAVFANTDSEDNYLEDITLVAAAKAFGLADPSSSSSSSSPAAANQSSASRRRSNLPRHADLTARSEDHGAGGPPPPPPDVDVLTGTYYNAGYGMGELCSVRSTSASCRSVLAAFCAIDPSLSPNSTSADLFASWVTLLSTHVRFTHNTNATGSQYVLSIGSIYPKGYGKNTTPFSTLAPSAKVEFVVEYEKVVGFGWYDLGEHVKREGSVEKTSDVWFVKEA
jgi:hypothetical protein